MTISYKHGFTRNLFRWKGSVWKAIFKEFLVFVTLYVVIGLYYRFIFDEYKKRRFEALAREYARYAQLLPMKSMLAFYVNQVFQRWKDQLEHIAWSEKLALQVSEVFNN